MEGFQNNFFYTTFHHHFKNSIFGYRFHFEGKSNHMYESVKKEVLIITVQKSLAVFFD